MPIYAYKCDSCGFAKDVLQKISDAPLVQCPSCQAQTFKKQVTAAGFQLKGSGWYATDFKGGTSAAPTSGDTKSGDAKSGDAQSGAAAESGGSAKTPSDSTSTSTASVKKAESTPGTGSGS